MQTLTDLRASVRKAAHDFRCALQWLSIANELRLPAVKIDLAIDRVVQAGLASEAAYIALLAHYGEEP